MGLQFKIAMTLSAFLCAAPAASAAGQPTVRVLSDRTEAHLKPLFAAFTKATGIAVSAAFVDQGLVTRLESRPDEAEVIITKDAELLAIAGKKGLLGKIAPASKVAELPETFRDPERFFFVDAYRARMIAYARARVKPEQLSGYEGLAGGEWRKRLCLRSGYHEYNLSLFSQFLAVFGQARTEAALAGYKSNLARSPAGNDREQAKGIAEGKCDVALINSYYHPIMRQTEAQRPWAEATGMFFPDQSGEGALIMRSGLALSRKGVGAPAASRLLEFFASQEGQLLITNTTFQYPVLPGVPLPEALRALGAGQPQVKDGRFKMRMVSLSEVVLHREAALRILDQLAFDTW